MKPSGEPPAREALTRSCLERTNRLEPAVGAWAHPGQEYPLAQSGQAGQHRRARSSWQIAQWLEKKWDRQTNRNRIEEQPT